MLMSNAWSPILIEYWKAVRERRDVESYMVMTGRMIVFVIPSTS
jgi:hypothetical protein